MESPNVSLRGLAVRRTGITVLRQIDLDARPGESIAVFGANGSGKTTLLRVLATLMTPSAGHGTILQADLSDTAAVERMRPRIGLVGHEPALYPNLTLLENLRLFAALALGRGTAGEAAHDALGRVGLGGAADRPAARSSNGMRRRVEFARLLITQPSLLLLDEAHVGLDPAAWALVGHIVEEVTGRDGTAFIVAHERDRVRPLTDRALMIESGVVEEVSP